MELFHVLCVVFSVALIVSYLSFYQYIFNYISLYTDGRVFSWGKAARGRLGRPPEDTQLPRQVMFREDDHFTVVSLSSSHFTTLLAAKRKLLQKKYDPCNLKTDM